MFSDSGTVTGSASRVDFSYRCDGGGLAMSGTLYDTACDAKSAKVQAKVYY